MSWFSICACMLSHFSRVRLCDPMDYNPPGSSVHGILKTRILEWVAMPSSRGSSRSRNWIHISFCLLPWQVNSLPLELPGKPGSPYCCFLILSILDHCIQKNELRWTFGALHCLILLMTIILAILFFQFKDTSAHNSLRFEGHMVDFEKEWNENEYSDDQIWVEGWDSVSATNFQWCIYHWSFGSHIKYLRLCKALLKVTRSV